MSSSAERREASRPLVLLVDDSVDNRTMYAEYLTFVGFDVIEAGDGASGVAYARAHLPAAVVMDLTLPVLDGYEATRLLRGDPTTKDTVVLALSGRGEGRQRALDAGVDAFCLKPCLPRILADHLHALLARAGGTRRPHA